MGLPPGQKIAAYKKWHGVAHMMDLGADAPKYGLMMDAELLLFDNMGEDLVGGGTARGGNCTADGPWSQLHSRIAEQEASKEFPAASVSNTLTTYSFGGGYKRSGRDYDRAIMQETLRWAAGKAMNLCEGKGCAEATRHVKEVLWSWWTDIPWVSIETAGRMMLDLVRRARDPGAGKTGPGGQWTPDVGWRKFSSNIHFCRFEHVGYQQWCALNEGFRFKDVTNLTGEAKWGSYMEDPLPGARLDVLQPMWISGQAIERVERRILPRMSTVRPPLLIFHADQGRERSKRGQNKAIWEEVLLSLLKKHGRKDLDQNSIK